ncbi:MAG: ATP-binding protein [Chloroflexi bacterium]|nr:ATP-binding protein [Chloroflexota bacterium]
MERIGDILQRRLGALGAGTGPSSTGADKNIAPPQTPAEVCPRCRGTGWVGLDAPVGHPDFGRAIPCTCRLEETIRARALRLQRYSNLGPLARVTFENLLEQGVRPDTASQALFRQAYAAAVSHAATPRGWFVLVGPSGSGKTHLAAAIANERLRLGDSVLFVVVPDLLDHLRAAYAPGAELPYDDLFSRVRETPFLVLDDLGAQSSTPWAQEKLFQVLNHRFSSHLPTVVTIGVPLDSLEERFRTRLTDTEIARVYRTGVEAAQWDRVGALDLALLRSMTFQTFNPHRVNLPKEQRESLEGAFRVAKEFAVEPEGWLVFMGENGCGKTHLAAAIANERVGQGHPVLFVIVPDLLDHLRFAFSPESHLTYDELFEKVRTSPLLILDDLGAQSATPWAQEKLFQIINYRYNARLPTVITTALSLDDIETRIGSRLADRRLSVVQVIGAPDYRVDRKPRQTEEPNPRRRGTFA